MRVLLLLLASVPAFAADDPPGAKLYKQHCAVCHDSGAARVPTQSALREMRASTIVKALEAGAMREQGSKMSVVERRSLSVWLGKTSISTTTGQFSNRCSDSVAGSKLQSWQGWGGAANTRFDAAGLRTADLPRLKLKWAFGLPDADNVRTQPAVYGGRVFMANQDGNIFSLDAATGCLHWATTSATQIRSGITVGVVGQRLQIFFGDSGGKVHSLEALTGKPIWQATPDEHPAAMVTSTPALYNGVLYVGASSYEEASATSPGYVCCTFRGSVSAFDAATGARIWKTYMIDETPSPRQATKRGAKTIGPSGAGVWTAPTIDAEKQRIYVTTGDNYSDPPTRTSDAAMALRMDNGAVVWSRQLTAGDAYNSACALPDKNNCPDSDGPDHDFASSAILVKTAARRLLLLPQKSGMMHAIDPDRNGEIVWQSRAAKGGVMGGLQWGSASDGARVYAPISDVAFQRERIPGSNDSRPTLLPGPGGGIVAFQIENGERVWFTPPPGCGERRPCSPAQSSAASAIRGGVFSGSLDGHMRVYSSADGKILWDFDTVREFQTVNGVPARGGAIDAGGPVIAGDMVFFGSGYGRWGGIPGNVLLAFQVER